MPHNIHHFVTLACISSETGAITVIILYYSYYSYCIIVAHAAKGRGFTWANTSSFSCPISRFQSLQHDWSRVNYQHICNGNFQSFLDVVFLNRKVKFLTSTIFSWEQRGGPLTVPIYRLFSLEQFQASWLKTECWDLLPKAHYSLTTVVSHRLVG